MSDGFVIAVADTPEGRKAAVDLMLQSEQPSGVDHMAAISNLWAEAVNGLEPIWQSVIGGTISDLDAAYEADMLELRARTEGEAQR